MRFMKRIPALRKSIELIDHKSGHLIVKVKMRGLRFERLTYIKSNISSIEKDVIRVHVYKLIDAYFTTRETKQHVRDMIGGLNYADCLGSPWLIEERGN